MNTRNSDYTEIVKLKTKKLTVGEKLCENLLQKLELCEVEEDEKVLKTFRRHTVDKIKGKSLDSFLKFRKRG